MKEGIKTKIINLYPYLCGVLYSIFISLAGVYATTPLTRLLSSMPFIPEYGVYLGLSLSCLVLSALTVVFNVYVFRKKAITVADIMFEILFPTITVIPLYVLWSFSYFIFALPERIVEIFV